MKPASVRTYDELVKALRARADELQVPREGIAAAAKLSERYVSKLLAPVPIKHLGPKALGPLLAALGLKLRVEEDVETLERIAKRITRRRLKVNPAGVEMQARARRKSQRFRPFRESPDLARMARAKQLLTQSQHKRKQIARTAAKARWRKPKIVEVKNGPYKALGKALDVTESEANRRKPAKSGGPRR